MKKQQVNMNNEKPLVLIVDDQVSVFDTLGKTLSENGYEIAVALNAADALEFMYGDLPDLILLDIHLTPGDPDKCEGFSVCKKFKTFPGTKDIPIIFLTVEENEANIVKGFDLGAVDYVIKRGLEKKRELLARVDTHINLKRAISTIEKQNEDLKHLNATKDKFFGIISHDLRNPFSPLLSDSEILETRYDYLNDEMKRKAIKRIKSSSQRLYKLLENLLEWANVQVGKKTLFPQTINLSDIVRSNIDLNEQGSKIKDVLIKNDIKANTTAFADSRMIDSVLRNLMGNALRFTGKGGKVRISTQEIGKFVEVSVCDTGVGIAKKDINKFFKIDGDCKTSDTEGEKGTGLGLVLCWEFVTRNGGKIWVESELGKGSTFKFTLPKSEKTY